LTPPDPNAPAGGDPSAPAERPAELAPELAPDAAPVRPGEAAEPASIDLTEDTIDLSDRALDVTDRLIDLTEVPVPTPAVDGAGAPVPAGPAGGSSEERQRALGARLRRIRAQQGLSLAQVEQRSAGRWKAVVVGAYERGDRAVTVERLAALAAFYDVPISHLLPPLSPAPEDLGDDSVLLDLTRLAVHDGRPDALGAIARFARRMQLQRGDHAGRVITLRDTDVRTIALAAGIEPTDLRLELQAAGVCDR
jgi:transcriptional regulator with XRE-family HTH domain